MTETQLEQLGFDLIKRYNHDEYSTNRYQKGVIQVEFTYLTETDENQTIDATIDEVDFLTVNISEVKDLDRILNKQ